ncbi:alginate lyase family protein [Hyphomicrobiaceae bacterium 22]|uniref:Alginate lyase family protein n=1 Tax=Prosthecodimorpha staleyi TaxID=2840188 RepID=A0A947D6Z1_9HYPH|nr:alginate lyase family protein [Prosthecodimorpha staleyi]MBT9292230.1 alginate lyase family protein [Prosthecodimorpha staleyi]
MDPARRAARDRAVAIYEAVVRAVQAGADDYALGGDASAGACALGQLRAWARGGVLVGALATQQGEYERAWYLTGLALGYLKLRPLDGHGRPVEDWLRAMADGVVAVLDQDRIPANNLLYWSGLALAASGLATGSQAHLARGQDILTAGLAAVAADGSLKAELDRGAKALDYHAFATAPLVLLAVIAEARGKPFDRAALERLGRFVLAGIADPAVLSRRTGRTQSRPEDWNLAWLPAYASLIPTRALPSHATRSHFLGGDIGATLAAIRSGTR